MEDAVSQLTKSFLKERDASKSRSEDDALYHVVIYEDIQNLMKMKTEYEAEKYIRLIQSFDQNYYQKVGLVWLGNLKG
jgi:negative regulator of genetic competence, sporulation and motility